MSCALAVAAQALQTKTPMGVVLTVAMSTMHAHGRKGESRNAFVAGQQVAQLSSEGARRSLEAALEGASPVVSFLFARRCLCACLVSAIVLS